MIAINSYMAIHLMQGGTLGYLNQTQVFWLPTMKDLLKRIEEAFANFAIDVQKRNVEVFIYTGVISKQVTAVFAVG